MADTLAVPVADSVPEAVCADSLAVADALWGCGTGVGEVEAGAEAEAGAIIDADSEGDGESKGLSLWLAVAVTDSLPLITAVLEVSTATALALWLADSLCVAVALEAGAREGIAACVDGAALALALSELVLDVVGEEDRVSLAVTLSVGVAAAADSDAEGDARIEALAV